MARRFWGWLIRQLPAEPPGLGHAMAIGILLGLIFGSLAFALMVRVGGW